MSKWHKQSRHTTHAVKIRDILKMTLPRPCVDCGRPVLPTDKWQVGHIIPASQGGQTTLANCGPSHELCNKRAGGRLGRSMQLRASKQRKDIREW